MKIYLKGDWNDFWSLWILYYLLNYDDDFALKSIWMINEIK